MDQDPKIKNKTGDQDENMTASSETQEKVESQCECKNDKLNKKVKELEDRLTEKEKEIEDLKNRWLRSQADFDNFRKRKQKEIHEIHLYSGEDFIKDLLPVIDNFERALSSSVNKEDPFYKGVELIYQQLLNVLRKHEVEEIKALGQAFDPNFHEAVMQVNIDEYDNDTVAEVLQKGYLYHSKVIRPSMVKVCKK